jgi:outer membrane protein assembly factor BamE (lipoprotein component of BamABCDE complex)
MNKMSVTLKTLAAVAAVLALVGCNTISKDAESSSMIVIQSITGTTTTGDTVAYLQSGWSIPTRSTDRPSSTTWS